jgi:hypothetical protein
VAAVSGTDFRQERDYRMTLKPNNIPSPAAGQPGRLPPVRVKLLRPDAFQSSSRLWPSKRLLDLSRAYHSEHAFHLLHNRVSNFEE